jgi:hypothetical protein
LTIRDTLLNAAALLQTFASNCRAALLEHPGPQGRQRVRELLEGVLKNKEFIDQYCVKPKPGLHRLYEDPELGFEILAHINEKPRVSPPHDHGDSWAVYGQATRYTVMTEWKRTDDKSDPAKAKLEPVKTYRLEPGHAGMYQDGMIHSIDYPENSCFVRVTGTNLDNIPRVMFDLKTGVVTQMTPQRAT